MVRLVQDIRGISISDTVSYLGSWVDVTEFGELDVWINVGSNQANVSFQLLGLAPDNQTAFPVATIASLSATSLMTSVGAGTVNAVGFPNKVRLNLIRAAGVGVISSINLAMWGRP